MLSARFCYLVKAPPPCPHHFYSYNHFYTWSGSRKSASAAAVLRHRANRAALSMHCFLIRFFIAKLQLPRVCIIPLLHVCPFSLHIVVLLPLVSCMRVALCECWCWGVGVGICGRVSVLIRPKRSHHFGTHTAHYFWLDVNSHRVEGGRQQSSWSLHRGCDGGLPTSVPQPL